MAISGLSASSIDVQSVVSQLMAVERRPVDKLSSKSAAYETKLSVLATLKNGIAKFQAAVKGLKDTGSFQSFSATSSDSTALTSSAGSSANAGTYSLNVSSLAQSQQLVAAGQASSSATIGAGTSTTLSFDLGTIGGGTFTSGTYSGASFTSNGAGIQTVTIDSTNNTLEGIRDAVNSAKIGVTASIINDGGASPYRLAFTSTASGVDNSISIGVSGDAALSSLLSHDPAGTQNLSETLTAQNANFTLNGVAITKSSNTVTDAIEGVTLNLTKVTTAPVNLTVTKDTAAINEAANTFIKEYNALMSDLKSLSAYASGGKSAGSLAGDPAVRQMITELTTIIGGTVSGGEFETLTSVGITTKPGVGLVLDSTLFNSAINNNLDDLANLFTSDEGFATKLDAWASTSINITITARTSNINEAISNIVDEIDLREVRLASLEKRYTTQFSNLNRVLASMSAQQTFISQAFSNNSNS
ncbi:MAG: flagellar filament capping protein FliD [Methylophilaceae bacterium]